MDKIDKKDDDSPWWAWSFLAVLIIAFIKFPIVHEYFVRTLGVAWSIIYSIIWSMSVCALSYGVSILFRKRLNEQKPFEKPKAIILSAVIAGGMFGAMALLPIPRPFGDGSADHYNIENPQNADDYIAAQIYGMGGILSEKQKENYWTCAEPNVARIKQKIGEEGINKINRWLDSKRDDPDALRIEDFTLGIFPIAALDEESLDAIAKCLHSVVTGAPPPLDAVNGATDMTAPSNSSPSTSEVASTGPNDGSWSLEGIWAYIEDFFGLSKKGEQAPAAADPDPQPPQPIANPDDEEVAEAPNLSSPPDALVAAQPVQSDGQYVAPQQANGIAKKSTAGPEEPAVSTPYSMRRDRIAEAGMTSRTYGRDQGMTQTAPPSSRASPPQKIYNVYKRYLADTAEGNRMIRLEMDRISACGVRVRADYAYNLKMNENHYLIYSGPFNNPMDALKERQLAVSCGIKSRPQTSDR